MKSVRFVDKPEAYTEFLKLFPDSPELTGSLQTQDMPPSYRVVPRTDDSNVVGALGKQFERQARRVRGGVLEEGARLVCARSPASSAWA